MHTIYFIFLVVFLAFVFDFINGFHDASNSIATVVATGVLKPKFAVCWAAFFNFIAFLFIHLQVASTIGTGLVSANIISPYLIFSALVGAIIFNLCTWYFGLPSSSSHALIGGLVGAGLVEGGWQALQLNGLTKVLVSIVISPILSIILAVSLMWLLTHLLRNWKNEKIERWFKKIQLISSALLSLSHGGNDAQKTMGVIAVLLYSTGLLGSEFYVPLWVMISCNLVMALGTLVGGWRIVNTLGNKITKLVPMSGCVAETSAAITIFAATHFGIPVSTTHTVTGAIVGVGTAKGFLATNWNIMRRIAWAWLFTIPVAGSIAAFITWLGTFFVA